MWTCRPIWLGWAQVSPKTDHMTTSFIYMDTFALSHTLPKLQGLVWWLNDAAGMIVVVVVGWWRQWCWHRRQWWWQCWWWWGSDSVNTTTDLLFSRSFSRKMPPIFCVEWNASSEINSEVLSLSWSLISKVRGYNGPSYKTVQGIETKFCGSGTE